MGIADRIGYCGKGWQPRQGVGTAERTGMALSKRDVPDKKAPRSEHDGPDDTKAVAGLTH